MAKPNKKSKKPAKKAPKNAYNKRPSLTFYVKDWLNDPNLKRAGLAAKGLWIDFMSTVHSMEVYGVFTFARVNPDVKNLLDFLLKQKFEQTFSKSVELLQNLLLQNAEFCSTFEDVFGYTADKFVEPLSKLLLVEVARINEHGFIFSGRMVRDAQLSEIRASAGMKGGKATQLHRIQNTESNKGNGDNFATDFATPKSVANTAIANAIANTYPINNNIDSKKNDSKEETAQIFETNLTNEFGIPDPVFTVYQKDYSDFAKLGVVAKGVSQEMFKLWKQWIDFIVTSKMEDIFVMQFPFPKDFTELVRQGFTQDRWERVMRKILGSGVNPQHKLLHRIPTCMYEWLKLEKPTGSTATGDQANSVQKKVYELQKQQTEKAYQANKIDSNFYKFITDRLKPGVDLDDIKREWEKQNK